MGNQIFDSYIFSLCIMCSVYFIYNYRSLWNNNLQLDQSILLSSTSNANSPEISILKDELMSNYDDVNNGVLVYPFLMKFKKN